MPKGDVEAITLEDFKGIWSRTPIGVGSGMLYDIPEGHFGAAQNLAHFSRFVKQREGYAAVPGPVFPITFKRFWIYPRDGDTNLHFIILAGNQFGINIYDTGSPTPATPILSNIPSNADISVVALFNRVYITLHDRQSGLAGLSIYVYKGDGSTARLAAGSGPATAPSAVQNSASLSNGLISFWPLNEASGLTRNDNITALAGGGNNLTNNNGVAQVPGVASGGFASSFDNVTNYLSIPNNSTLQVGGGDFSFSAWVKITGSFTGIVIASKATLASAGEWDCIVSANDGKVHFRIYSGGVLRADAVSAAGISLNTWVYIVGTYVLSTHTASLYINNGAPTTAVAGVDPVNTAVGFSIGATADGLGLNGGGPTFIQRAGFWKHALSVGEVNSLFGAPANVGMDLTFNGSGNVSQGTHIIGVAFETDTGFVTQTARVRYIAPDSISSIFVTIPLGPAGTAARRILVSKVLPFYDGNIVAQQLFFHIRVPDNGTTLVCINPFDSALQADGTYLDDLLVSIPAGVGISQYQGRLVAWGENANQTTVRMSNPGDPESFSSTGGFVTLPRDGGTVLNIFEWRGLFYMCKRYRTYVTRDNGGPPNTWTVEQVDGAIGTECFGIARVGDISVSTTRDIVLVANRQGLYIFRGSYLDRPLTWKIETLWQQMYFGASFSYIQCFVDPYLKRVYVTFIGDQVGPTGMLVGDFVDGLDPDNIKWEPWIFNGGADRPLSFGVYVSRSSNSSNSLYMVIGDNHIYQFDPMLTTDRGQPLTWSLQFPYVPFTDDLSLSNLAWLRFLMDLGGTIQVNVGNYSEVPSVYNIAATPGVTADPRLPKTVLVNKDGELFLIKFLNVSQTMTLYKLIAGGKPLYQSRQII